MSERIQRVMVITAHPDDSEFGAGGTIAKLTREGKIVTYCILTNGNKGSSDRTMTPERLAQIREEEQKNAARVLGVDIVDFLGFPDGELEDTRESRMAVAAAIRRHRPTSSSARIPTARRISAPPTETTARRRASPSTACIRSPATTWPFPS
jgi:Uncharacterized proteins, LmbE homologs